MRKGLVLLVAIGMLFSGCIGGNGDSQDLEFNGMEYEPAPDAPGFTLTDQHGNEVSMSDYKGKVVVVAFVFTHCPDVCLQVEANLAAVESELAGHEDGFVIVSITVDPARDTVEKLSEWTTERGYDWPHLTSTDHIYLNQTWSNWGVAVDNDHIYGDHSSHGDMGDHSEMSHQVAILYPDNTTTLLDGHHDMLPENATGWNLTKSTLMMNNVSLNSSVHEQYGNQVHGINGVDAPSDSSWWWSLHIWNETSMLWEESPVGVDEVMVMHHTDHVAWAASNANLSLLPTPGGDMDNHDGHSGHGDHADHGESNQEEEPEEIYTVGHSTVTYIVDQDGKKRVAWVGSDWSHTKFAEDVITLMGSSHDDHGDHDSHDSHSGHGH